MSLASTTVLRLRLSRVLLCAFAICGLAQGAGLQAQPSSSAGARQVRDLDGSWKFATGDIPNAQSASFDDSGWSTVSVPHDWSIAGPIDKANPTGQGGGYFPNGVGWYRREIPLSEGDRRRHVYVVFDGVMANSEVWINGTSLGVRPNGTVSFFYELTGHLNYGLGAHNIVAVRCDNARQPVSRWYEGAGIYRPVRLVVLNDVHTEPWSTVATTPKVSAGSATVHVETTLVNDSTRPQPKVDVMFEVIGPDGRIAKSRAATRAIAAKSSVTVGADIEVANPAIWDLDRPSMYRAVASVKVGERMTDEDEVPFGIREFHFDADTGFWLNGRNFKLKGAAMHMDGGAVGIAVPDAVYEHRLRALKALGVNAIRTAHNPPSPQFLDLCDRLGMLVMDEMFDQWTVGKNPYDYHLVFKDWYLRDTADTVRRDRNHPSIILYSAGNEIHDTPHPEIAIPILKALVETFHKNDPTRPVTQALFRPNVSHDYDNGLADLLDVVGQNYREKEILAAHELKPTRKIVGTENGPDREIWLALRDHPAYSGQFLWTGVDYLGEAGEAGGWPTYVNSAGLIDKTGYPRARGYERQSWWADAPSVHVFRRIAPTEKLNVDPGYENVPARFKQVLFADWTPQNTTEHDESVEVYTNCDEVELTLNGVSLGRQKLHADASPLTWKVPFARGTIEAVAYRGGKEVAGDRLATAAGPARIVLKPERATVSSANSDLVYVTAMVTDALGNVVPDAANLVHFTVSGPGTIIAVDSGNNADHDSFQQPERHLFEGRAVALVRATASAGTITVTATSAGLTDGTTTLLAVPVSRATFAQSF